MVDNKDKTKKVIGAKPNTPKESKAETFKRIAQPRVKNVLKALRILGNCSNRANYDYTQEQVDKISESILSAFDTVIGKFTKSKTEQENFKF